MAREIRRSRETWVDAAKVLACVLVALGHFYQSMVNGYIVESSTTYIWFIRTIYYFHVPLFFLCCGYLYQNGNPVKTVDGWKQNVLKMLVTLGVPFVIFTCGNWAVNVFVSGSTGDLLQELFVEPAAPYWYLYTLFFVFLLTPTISNTTSAMVIVGCAVGAKGVSLVMGSVGIYAADTLFSYWFWFVIGMLLSQYKVPKALRKQKISFLFGVALLVLFIAGSVALVVRKVNTGIVGFIFGICGCGAVVILTITAKFAEGTKKIIRWLSDYALPVLLMHPIFATGMRSVLLKLGVTNAILHVVVGLVVTFAGPILVGIILKKLKWAEFILYPGKFINFGPGEKLNHSQTVQER
ncbi:MAG: acyltransferase [Ruminococcaceae bacterium]|nr:acyltransferase [Oscillospiraceae bacterium]